MEDILSIKVENIYILYNFLSLKFLVSMVGKMSGEIGKTHKKYF